MRRALSLFAGLVVMLFAARASANFHLTKIVQVYAGTTPNTSYIQLRSYAAGQNVLTTHNVFVYDQGGTVIQTIPLATTANSGDQANVLIGGSGVQAAFGSAPDFTLPNDLVQAGGKVCFDTTPIDCFAWGAYIGSPTGVGMPFAALTLDMAATRKTSGGTNPSCLDPMDDTDSSIVDFVAAVPAPKNNNSANVVCLMSTVDGGASDAAAPGQDAATPAVDSGISTVPTPPREAGPASDSDSGATSPSSGDDSGCSLGPPASSEGGWSTMLGLAAAASILLLARRRRGPR